MAFIAITAVATFILFGWCFVVNTISLSPKNARICRLSLISSGGAGAFLCILSGVLFAVALSNSDADDTVKAVVGDSYIMFVGTNSIFIAVGLFITLVSSLLKSKLRPVIPLILPMWATISLFWTYMCAVWSDFAQLDASAYVILFGIGEAAMLTFSALPQTNDRVKILYDDKKRKNIIALRTQKKEQIAKKKAARKSLAEKKKRLRHPNK